MQQETRPTKDLRDEWFKLWGIQPHRRIGRKMLERSIVFKRNEKHLDPCIQKRLNRLVQNYKRNPKYFDEAHAALKIGTAVTKNWHGVNHTVTLKEGGFEYQGISYTSLSKIAFIITGTKWNGWRFFGLRKAESNS